MRFRYADDGNLGSHLAPGASWDEASSKALFFQLVLGTDYCHRKGISNRDMKLENILLKRSVVGQGDAVQVR
jgi:serine/threonine-protein kinase SRK2